MTELTTHLIHHPYHPPEGFAAPLPAIHKASTVIFPSVAAMRARDWRSKDGYTYGLHGTPSTFMLEERLAALEGGEQCLLVPSGLAAIAAVNLALLGAGDEVLIPDNAYNPNKVMADADLARFGIRHQLYDPMNPADLAARLSARTRLVWLEAPGSVSMEFPDLMALVALCKAKGVVTVLDNTWGAGLAFAPFEAGVDVSVQALTKYPSGGGDVLMGSIITRDEELHLKLKASHMHLGWGVGGDDVQSLLRSLPSISLRYRAQDQCGRALARWFQGRAEVVQVLHPALPGSPGHEHWATLCGKAFGGQGGAAGLFSVVFDARYSQAQVDGFCEALQLFKLGYSWGSAMSLVVPQDLKVVRRAWSHAGSLVRFSMGLEDCEDLRRDLEQALATLAR